MQKITNLYLQILQQSQRHTKHRMQPAETKKEPTTDHENHTGVIDNEHTDAIHYEDGKIQKKVYGGGQFGASKQAFVHLIQRQKKSVQTFLVNIETALTVKELSTLLEQKTKIALNNLQVKIKLENQPVKGESLVSAILSQNTSGQERPQFYFFYDETKAIIKQKVSQLKYEPLTKYSFIDEKGKVKVYIELEGIGKVPAENITSRFLQWSIEVRIHDYKGKNWIFAVPKTQCLMKNKECKVIQKENKLIVSIAKNADADNWFSLYKVRCVGERGDD